MGQKSLSSLHRIDSSMIWSSYIHDKKFKWISYNLWFMYIQFYKIIFIYRSHWKFVPLKICNFNDHFLTKNISNYKHPSKEKQRFGYYIDLYCIEVFNYLLLLNIYFHTTLSFYKDKRTKKTHTKKLCSFF